MTSHLPVFISTCPGRVGRTFQADIRSRRDEIEFDPDSLSFGENEDGEMETKGEKRNLMGRIRSPQMNTLMDKLVCGAASGLI